MSWISISILMLDVAAGATASARSGVDAEIVPVVRDTVRIGSAALPYTLVKASSHGWAGDQKGFGVFGDFDGDGWDELVLATIAEELTGISSLIWHDYTDGHAYTIRQLNLTGVTGVNRFFPDDMDGDGAQDLAIGRKQGSLAWGEIYGNRGRLIFKTPTITGSDIHGTGVWDGHVTPLRAVDLNADGHRDLLCKVFGAFDLKPRGLLAYDGLSGERIWFFRAGSPLTDMYTFPLTHPDTGELVLLVATYSVHNGSREGGIPDSQSYLFLLGADGRLIEQRIMGGSCTGVSVAVDDLDDDRRLDAAVALSGNLHLPTSTYGMWILDPFTLKTRREIDPGAYLDAPRICDVEGDGSKELITRTRQEILVYDSDLRLLSQIPVEGTTGIWQVADLTGNGRPEVLMSIKGASAAVVSPAGEVLAARTFTDRKVSDMHALRWAPRRQLLYCVTQRGALGWDLQPAPARVAPPSLSARPPVNWPFAVGALAIAMVGGAGLTLLFLRSRTVSLTVLRRRGGVPEGDPDELARQQSQRRAALAELTACGHGEPGAVMARAATLLLAATDTLVVDPEWQRQVADTCAVFRSTLAPVVRSVVAFGDILGELDFAADKILSDYRAIEDETEQLLDVLGSGQWVPASSCARIGRSIKQLDDVLRQARETLRATFACDVLEAVNLVLATKRQVMRDAGVSEYGLVVGGDDDVRAQIDCQRLRAEILDDLITNAARAVADAAVRKITITVHRESDTIKLSVSDTGSGIDADLMARLFDRDVTTKEAGGGFGLYQASRTAQEFGGRIFVEKSTPGAGTTMTVVIPAASPSSAHP